MMIHNQEEKKKETKFTTIQKLKENFSPKKLWGLSIMVYDDTKSKGKNFYKKKIITNLVDTPYGQKK